MKEKKEKKTSSVIDIKSYNEAMSALNDIVYRNKNKKQWRK